MEPWVDSIVQSVDNKKLIRIDSSTGIKGKSWHNEQENSQDTQVSRIDPHIWLDLGNAQIMVDTICSGLIKIDPANAAFYKKNAAAYKARLQALDKQYRKALTPFANRIFIEGGHYAFGYLAARYQLRYIATSGLSPMPNPCLKSCPRYWIWSRNIRYILFFMKNCSRPASPNSWHMMPRSTCSSSTPDII